jgi:DNA polymerase-1
VNAKALLKHLHTLNVLVTVSEMTLHLDAPKGCLTPELQAEIVEQKPALLQLLSPQLVENDLHCCLCTFPVEYYSDTGKPYCRTHRFAQTSHYKKATPSLLRITEKEFFLSEVNHLLTRLQGTSTPLALDLETTGLDMHRERIISIAFGSVGKVVLLDMRPYYDLPEEQQAQWKQALAALFHMPHITWVGHNLKFDWGFLATHFGVHLSCVYDTMLAEQLLVEADASTGKVSLLETARRYGIAVSKAERQWFEGLNQRPEEWQAPFPHVQVDYMVQDIEVPLRIREQQLPLLKHHHLETVMHIENQALPATASMEVHGALIDQETWRQVLRRKRERQATLEQTLLETLGTAFTEVRQQRYQQQVAHYTAYQEVLKEAEKRLAQEYVQGHQGKSTLAQYIKVGIAGWKEVTPAPEKPRVLKQQINLSSSDQLLEALTHLGIPVTSTQEAILEAYEKQYPLLATLLAWRKLNHFCTAFGENLLAHIKPDGRIHTNFNQIGAASGRMICRNPNLQQIPKKQKEEAEEEDVRRCFIASPGHLLLKADLSNIELRILAEVAKDTTLLRLFAEGADLHAETAKLMFRLPADANPKELMYNGVVMREIAKTINYGLAYGMGAQGLANRVNVDMGTAKGLMQTYFTTYKGVALWLRTSSRQALQQGFATTIAGRRRAFAVEGLSAALRGRAERSAKNHPIQGANADILKRALALLYEALPSQVHIILAVHDELVLECPEELVGEAEQILKRAMVQACRTYLKVVAIPEPDVLIAPYWKKD